MYPVHTRYLSELDLPWRPVAQDAQPSLTRLNHVVVEAQSPTAGGTKLHPGPWAYPDQTWPPPSWSAQPGDGGTELVRPLVGLQR